jgi:hypothetical protein
VQAQHQRVEVEVLGVAREQFAVENEALRREPLQRLDDLREVARERPLVAAAQVDLVAVAEGQAAEAVPLWLVDVVTGRQLARELPEHRLDQRTLLT